MPASTADTSHLLDVVAIETLLRTHCRALDRVDRDLLASCYHDDAVDRRAGEAAVTAPDVVAREIDRGERRRARSGGTMHYLSNTLIDVAGDLARAESYLYVCYWEEPSSDPEVNYAEGARAVDRFARRDGEWRLAERVVLREFRQSFVPGTLTVYHDESHVPQYGLSDFSYDRSR
jgi:hypothetical protein